MPDARRAILAGTYEAARTHEKLESQVAWDHDHGRIDVFDAIDRLRLPLMFQPMETLLGAYLVRPAQGILINTHRPRSVQRYTAAHELGHFRLSHEPSLDGEDMLKRSPFTDRVGYDAKEIEADAFAVAFLLPQWLVAGQMRRHGWTPAHMQEPATVYQLALRAGLSYEATCYALRSYKVIKSDVCARLVEVERKAIKQSLIPDYEPPQTWHLDVWELGPRDDGLFVEIAPGDLILFSLPEHSGGGYLWDIAGINHSEFELLHDRRAPLDSGGGVGGHVVRQLTTRARGTGFGSIRFVERRPWERGSEPLSSYQFSYNIAELRQAGLLAAQRGRIIGGLE